MSTNESKVKDLVKTFLKSLGPVCWYNMPVPYGYGEPTLDFIGFIKGYGFAIETKAPGQKPTERQERTIERMREAGAAVFVVDGPDTLKHFIGWTELLPK